MIENNVLGRTCDCAMTHKASNEEHIDTNLISRAGEASRDWHLNYPYYQLKERKNNIIKLACYSETNKHTFLAE